MKLKENGGEKKKKKLLLRSNLKFKYLFNIFNKLLNKFERTIKI